MRIIVASLICCLLVKGTAQAQEITGIKLSKNERMLVLATNDTLRKLATLFILKRTSNAKSAKQAAVGLGISSVVFLAGGSLLLSIDNAAGIVTGLPLLFIGAGGGIYFIGNLGVIAFMNSRYSFKRFNKLLKMYNNGEALPEFYLQRMAKF